MPIAHAIVAAMMLFAKSGASPTGVVAPPIVVHVTAASGIPSSLVDAVLIEAGAIWRSAGIVFIWDRGAPARPRASSVLDASGPTGLLVTIGDRTGPPGDGDVPLGWIVFDRPSSPEREIYLSYANAVSLLTQSPGIAGPYRAMPPLRREILLARAMGRALAHELGHYLFASTLHTRRGLMTAVHSAHQLFDPERAGFEISPDEQRRVAGRFSGFAVASRG